MSKMSDIAMQLDEQCAELGFRDLEDAKQHGWLVNYEEAKLEPPVVQPKLNELEELEKAHEAWQHEKEVVLGGLTNLLINRAFDNDIIARAIKFIREDCHD